MKELGVLCKQMKSGKEAELETDWISMAETAGVNYGNCIGRAKQTNFGSFSRD